MHDGNDNKGGGGGGWGREMIEEVAHRRNRVTPIPPLL
jgi:hypothetical protein